jgi:hypothetical protein
VSAVSLTLTLIHQLLYCLPNWQQLVTKPLAASGLSVQTVLLTHAVYGLITAVHQYVQLRVLATHGAMSVGLVNAVRASVVSVVSSVLFCNVKPQLCLTYWRGISALVVTVGAMQWVIAGKSDGIRLAKAGQQHVQLPPSTGSRQQHLNDNAPVPQFLVFCFVTVRCCRCLAADHCQSCAACTAAGTAVNAAPSAGKPLTRTQVEKKQE